MNVTPPRPQVATFRKRARRTRKLYRPTEAAVLQHMAMRVYLCRMAHARTLLTPEELAVVSADWRFMLTARGATSEDMTPERCQYISRHANVPYEAVRDILERASAIIEYRENLIWR